MQNLSSQTQLTPIQKASNYFFNGLVDLTVQTIIIYQKAKQEEQKVCLVTK
jgi:hypothetical protein